MITSDTHKTIGQLIQAEVERQAEIERMAQEEADATIKAYNAETGEIIENEPLESDDHQIHILEHTRFLIADDSKNLEKSERET